MVGMKPQRAFGQICGLLERGAVGHLTDAQLLELFSRKRDADIAFEALVLRHGPAVLCTCRMVLGDRGEADDAFQATFLVLARRASSLRLAESVGPWLQGVARRISLKARMAGIRRRVHERRSAVSVLIDPESRFDFSDTLREAVGRLPEHLRAPIVLCYLERKSYKSAAKELGVSEGTIRGRLAKARESLRLRLSHELDSRSPDLRRESSTSLEHGVPPMLVDATTRAGVCFYTRGAGEPEIAAPIERLAEAALRMMFVSRIIRAVAVVLVGALGAALVERQVNGARIAAKTVSGLPQIASLTSAETAPRRATEIAQLEAKREPSRDILIQGAAVRTIPENDQVAVDGPGTMSLWVDRRFLTEEIAPVAQGQSPAPLDPAHANQNARPAGDGSKTPRREPVLLEISWTGQMRLIGRTTDAEGRPSGRAEFRGQVIAATVDALIGCKDEMIVVTAGPVPLERVEILANGPAKDDLARQPKTEIVTIHASREAVVVNRIVDRDRDRHRVVKQQRFEADDSLDYDRRTGSYQVAGKGRLILFDRVPEAPPTAKRPAHPLNRIDIAFKKGAVARLGAGNEADTVARYAEFSGGVTVTSIDVTDVKIRVERDTAGVEGCYMETDNLSIVSEACPPGVRPSPSDSLYIKASGNVRMVSPDSTIESDSMFFVLREETIYARGDASRSGLSDGQQSPKQLVPALAPKDLKFDLKDGKKEWIDRAATKFLDEKMPAPRFRVTPPPVDREPAQPRAANKSNAGPP